MEGIEQMTNIAVLDEGGEGEDIYQNEFDIMLVHAVWTWMELARLRSPTSAIHINTRCKVSEIILGMRYSTR